MKRDCRYTSAMAPVTYHLGEFPPAQLVWEHLIPLIGQANAALARYDGLLSAIPDSRILLSPMITQEAVLSSRIEGTVATIGEVLEVEAGGDLSAMQPERRQDAHEVLNYRRAMRFCESALYEGQPLSQHLLRGAHEILLRDVRGVDKRPGLYRTHQNWIGEHGCSVEDASFVPIPQVHLQAGLDRWEQFLAGDGVPDPLVHLALVHAEFEALHPFMDGNGRLGRMIIPLLLYRRGTLSGPHFYVSAFFDANRDEYLDRLRAISANGAWTEWTLFFLEAIRVQARQNETKAREILNLYAEVKERAVEVTHSQYAMRAVDFLFQSPIFLGPHFVESSNIPRPTAIRILRLLREAEIVQVLRPGAGRSAGLYAFASLVNVVEGRSAL
jgi:Fic family protein